MDNRPIGVFDSGLGGLTAVRRLAALMPNENIIYFGDTGRVPYGTRSRETILRYAAQDVNFLHTFDQMCIRDRRRPVPRRHREGGRRQRALRHRRPAGHWPGQERAGGPVRAGLRPHR